jgi:hypothetical protein
LPPGLRGAHLPRCPPMPPAMPALPCPALPWPGLALVTCPLVGALSDCPTPVTALPREGSAHHLPASCLPVPCPPGRPPVPRKGRQGYALRYRACSD